MHDEVDSGGQHKVCPGCATSNDAWVRFCEHCGTRLGETSEPAPAPEPPPAPDPPPTSEPHPPPAPDPPPPAPDPPPPAPNPPPLAAPDPVTEPLGDPLEPEPAEGPRGRGRTATLATGIVVGAVLALLIGGGALVLLDDDPAEPGDDAAATAEAEDPGEDESGDEATAADDEATTTDDAPDDDAPADDAPADDGETSDGGDEADQDGDAAAGDAGPASPGGILGEVVEDLREEHADLAEADVQCPEDEVAVVGRVYACEAETAAEVLPVQIVLHDAVGTYHARVLASGEAVPDLDEVYAEVGDGALCADLEEAGQPYDVAVAYWRSEGSPARMDASEDQIPCTTIYAESEIEDYWDEVGEAG